MSLSSCTNVCPSLILAPQVTFQKICSVFFHPWSVKVQWYWRGTVVSPLWCSVRQQAWYSTTLHCVCNRGGGSTWRPSSASGLPASVLASSFMISWLKHLRCYLIYWSSLHSKFVLHFSKQMIRGLYSKEEAWSECRRYRSCGVDSDVLAWDTVSFWVGPKFFQAARYFHIQRPIHLLDSWKWRHCDRTKRRELHTKDMTSHSRTSGA